MVKVDELVKTIFSTQKTRRTQKFFLENQIVTFAPLASFALSFRFLRDHQGLRYQEKGQNILVLDLSI